MATVLLSMVDSAVDILVAFQIQDSRSSVRLCCFSTNIQAVCTRSVTSPQTPRIIWLDDVSKPGCPAQNRTLYTDAK